jgi:hypothetical protein
MTTVMPPPGPGWLHEIKYHLIFAWARATCFPRMQHTDSQKQPHQAGVNSRRNSPIARFESPNVPFAVLSQMCYAARQSSA